MLESEGLLTMWSMDCERLRLALGGLLNIRGEKGGDGVFCGDSCGDETVIPFNVWLMSATGDKMELSCEEGGDVEENSKRGGEEEVVVV